MTEATDSPVPNGQAASPGGDHSTANASQPRASKSVQPSPQGAKSNRSSQQANSAASDGQSTGQSANRNRRRRRGGRGKGQGGGAQKTTQGTQGSPQSSASPKSEAFEPESAKAHANAPAASSMRVQQTSNETSEGAHRPKIGDSRPAPDNDPPKPSSTEQPPVESSQSKRRRRGGRGRSKSPNPNQAQQGRLVEGVRSGVAKPVTAMTGGEAIDLDDDVLEERRGKTRKGKPVGRYLMAVHVQPEGTQIAILEGRSLIEHYVAKPADDITQIHGNIYLGRVQNVLPGMEAAFVDIGTPKNAVLYRGDLHFDPDEIDERDEARIEDLLKPKQTVLCQVTKNPIMHKGARLTQEVSLPGRFVVLVPNSKTVGISKRLPDAERKRLRKIIDRSRPDGHGVIVRTAAENITAPEIERDLAQLLVQWEKIAELAAKASAPALLYREPDMALRVIREELSRDFRSVIIDDAAIHADVHDYVASVSPALAERVSYFDPGSEPLPLYEKYHIAEQLRRALDRKVWLPSGGSLIIEHTEALTVIDVNTGKNVGKSNLEDTVFENNLEAAQEIARQLRLRDVGGIIVIDFVDMEIKKNRAEVVRVFREALARDKTRTQVFDISELGLVQMTRKRIGEGLLESLSQPCEHCEGRGLVVATAFFEK